MPLVSASPDNRQDVAQSNVIDFQTRHRLGSEDPPTYDAGVPIPEPPTVSAPVDPTGDILRSCGAMAVAVYYIARSNPDRGIPNTYAMLEEQCGLGTRQMQRVCAALVAHGYFVVTESGGGRTKERRFAAVNHDIKGDIKGDTDDVVSVERVSETTTKRVTLPPTPPVVNVPLTSNNDQETERTPPKPPKPKSEPYFDGFDAFWSAYPRRDDRKGAEAIWARIKPDAALLAKMLAAIERQGLAAKEPQFRPMPTTWLNRERWNDEGGSPPRMNGAAPVITDRENFDVYGSWGKPKGAQS